MRGTRGLDQARLEPASPCRFIRNLGDISQSAPTVTIIYWNMHVNSFLYALRFLKENAF